MATQAQTERRKQVPPYLPYKTFSNTLAGWLVALPGRIDRSVLNSYSGAMQSWVLAALRYFSLIDADGHPTERLQQLVSAEGEARQKLLKVLVDEGYPFLIGPGFDLSKGTAAQLDEKFRGAGANGDTVRRCVAFFMGLAKDAGIPLSPYLKPTRRKLTNGRKAQSRKPREQDKPEIPPTRTPPQGGTERPDYQVLYDLLDPADMDEAEQQAVWTLLRFLKRKGA
ncbi:MAG: hypothetical protein F4137_00175 [Acidobacteria bacterium]|nr:hypothetical protein [Acidobacteriota bacterium]